MHILYLFLNRLFDKNSIVKCTFDTHFDQFAEERVINIKLILKQGKNVYLLDKIVLQVDISDHIFGYIKIHTFVPYKVVDLQLQNKIY